MALANNKALAKQKKDLRVAEIDTSTFGVQDRSLSELAYDRVLDILISGELRAGAPLQERKLAEALHISRTPVREALKQLESEGLVVRQLGRLTTVLQISVPDFVEIFEVRKLLEVQAAGLAAGRVSDESLAAMRASVKKLMKSPDPTASEHWEVDEMVHFTIAAAAKNKLMSTMIRDLRRRTHVFNTQRIPERRRPGALEHLALIDALEAGDAAKARQLMTAHLDNARDAIVDQITRSAGRRGNWSV
jgi:DNA-binding GntR family transcriptional regulator